MIVRAAAGDGVAGGGGSLTGLSRSPEGSGTAELVVRRWSWPGPAGKPVYNFRAEGRTFANSPTGGRCLIPLDAFFEFTDPGTAADAAPLSLPLPGQGAPPSPRGGEGVARRPGKGRKDKWRFAAADGGLLGVAGLWRAGVVPAADGAAARGSEAFTMLTCDPGPDIAPYHSRQIVLMPRDHWAAWLGADAGEAGGLIAPAPAGTLRVTRVG